MINQNIFTCGIYQEELDLSVQPSASINYHYLNYSHLTFFCFLNHKDIASQLIFHSFLPSDSLPFYSFFLPFSLPFRLHFISFIHKLQLLSFLVFESHDYQFPTLPNYLTHCSHRGSIAILEQPQILYLKLMGLLSYVNSSRILVVLINQQQKPYLAHQGNLILPFPIFAFDNEKKRYYYMINFDLTLIEYQKYHNREINNKCVKKWMQNVIMSIIEIKVQ